MAYLGAKSGEQMLAKQNSKQAMLNRHNACMLQDEMPQEANRLREEAGRLEAEADQLDPVNQK